MVSNYSGLLLLLLLLLSYNNDLKLVKLVKALI